MKLTTASALLALILSCNAALAEPATATLDGLVQRPLQLTADDMVTMPPSEIESAFLTGHGPETAHYKGVTLWALLERAGLAVEPGDRRNSLRHYVLVTGRDGYAVTIAIGEIDPNFEGKSVILAYDKDGKPLAAEGLRIVVPGDQHGGRSVHDVVHLEVK